MGRETRLKLYTDESRIWNIGMRIVEKHSYMIGFMWDNSIVKSALNITGTKKRFIYNDNISEKRLSWKL